MTAANKYNRFKNEPWFVFRLLNVTFSIAIVTFLTVEQLLTKWPRRQKLQKCNIHHGKHNI